jgi:hypothetical protein
MADLRNLFERQVNLHGIARLIPLLEENFEEESNSENNEEQNGSSDGSVDNLTDSDFGDLGSDDEDSFDSDDTGFSSEGDEIDYDSVGSEIINYVPPRERIYVHEPVDFASLH